MSGDLHRRGPLRLLAALLLLSALTLSVQACAQEQGSTVVPETTGKTVNRSVDSVTVDPSGNVFNPAEIYQQTADGVIAISAIFGNSTDPFSAGAAQGSGFVLDGEGEIVTNAHVITEGEGEDRRPATSVYVEFLDGDVIPAEVVGFDPFTDTGLIKVDPAEVDLSPLELGNSDQVVVGEPVAVIGSPFGEDHSLSTGVVSQIGRSVRSLTSFQIDGAIQTDASINPGNSGGPMLDSQGRVIGISQQIVSGSGASDGVGFAVPVNSIKRSVEQLRREGKATYAYIGVTTQPIYPRLAERFDLGTDSGALIAEVLPDGPADAAGVRGGEREVEFQGERFAIGGDVVVEADGQPVTRAEDLGRIIASLTPGEKVVLGIIRDGRRENVEVELGERPTALRNP